jgi:hypothetical protein
MLTPSPIRSPRQASRLSASQSRFGGQRFESLAPDQLIRGGFECRGPRLQRTDDKNMVTAMKKNSIAKSMRSISI